MVKQQNFIDIAGPALQQLYYGAGIPEALSQFCEPINWFKMAQLTGLTKLEITDYDYPETDGPYLLNIGLVELVLVRCRALEAQLFVPGAFPNLERLRIEANCFLEELEAVREFTEELLCVGGVILGLPKLQQISGGCELFYGEMKEGLQNWDHALLRADSSVSSWEHHRNLWTRR